MLVETFQCYLKNNHSLKRLLNHKLINGGFNEESSSHINIIKFIVF